MANPIIVVDVDITLVRTDRAWWRWMEQVTGKHLEDIPAKLPYNISTLFEDSAPEGIDLFDYWRDGCVYHTLVPREGSVECLSALKEQGWDVVFASHIKGLHHKSKVNFLKRWFPFMDGFHATKEKGYLRADAVVDDRIKFLNQFTSDIKKFLIATPYEQCQEPIDDVHFVNSWWEIQDRLLGGSL